MASYGPGTLSRTQTAPVPARGAPVTQYPGGMGTQPRTSSLSGTTAVSSASTASLSSMASAQTLTPVTTGGQVVATNNIINQRADASRSLYQICVNLKERLATVPGFEEYWSDFEEEEDGEESDPVSSLWRCLRKGYPLMTIYNATKPAKPLSVDPATTAEKNRPKTAASRFVLACLKELALPPVNTFSMQDLFGDDTTGFVKVGRMSWSRLY